MENFDWNLIRTFVAVGEHGSLSGAARALGSSQPTVGRHVDELEQALGQTLFVRGKRGYELTEAGAALMPRGQAAVESFAAVTRQAAGQEERIAGTVRIAASDVVAAYVVPEIMARLAAAEPDIEVEVVASDRVENLLRRDADIAVRMVRPTQQDLVARHIADIEMSLCAARSYIDRRGKPMTVEELLTHDMVGLDRSDLIIQGFAQGGLTISRHAFRFRADNQIVYWNAVLAGNGVGFSMMPLIERTPELERLLPEIRPPDLPMWLAMHRDVRSSARIRRVADFLGEGLEAFVAGR
jgi:DNA-binding transcriptional LysR family regulator